MTDTSTTNMRNSVRVIFFDVVPLSSDSGVTRKKLKKFTRIKVFLILKLFRFIGIMHVMPRIFRKINSHIIPTLKKIKVRYEAYSPWFKDIENHCSIHTGFYPEGYAYYLSHCFLMYTDFEESVKLLFSFLPVSSIVEVGNCLLVFTNAFQSNITRSLFCTLYDMKIKGILKKFHHAVALYHIRG